TVWSTIEPGVPSVPALFTATSSLPNRATVRSTIWRTCSSLLTSAATNSASAPSSCSSATSAAPAVALRPEHTNRAPSRPNASAVHLLHVARCELTRSIPHGLLESHPDVSAQRGGDRSQRTLAASGAEHGPVVVRAEQPFRRPAHVHEGGTAVRHGQLLVRAR